MESGEGRARGMRDELQRLQRGVRDAKARFRLMRRRDRLYDEIGTICPKFMIVLHSHYLAGLEGEEDDATLAPISVMMQSLRDIAKKIACGTALDATEKARLEPVRTLMRLKADPHQEDLDALLDIQSNRYPPRDEGILLFYTGMDIIPKYKLQRLHRACSG